MEKTIPTTLAVAGEMGERILDLDWSRTPLGPIALWSSSLRNAVSLMSHNRFPMLLWWGREYISIYNDAYIPVLGEKHPWGLGRPVRECWSEIWHILQPLIDSPFHGGPSTWMDDICLIINRNGWPEETHFTVAYSPVSDLTAAGGIGGVLATVTETTAQVINERALETLRTLSSSLIGCQSEKEVLAKAAQAIGENKSDFPWVVVYGKEDFEGETSSGLLRQAVETKASIVVTDAEERTMAIPILLQGQEAPAAVLFAGLNPYRQPDESYMSFVRLVTDQIAQALANATVLEAERRRAEAVATLDKAKTIFFSNISHEFRTPLTLMLGPLEALLQQPDVPWDTARKPVETAYRNALRLLKLVNTLLDFSRIESARPEARFVATDLGAYTRNLVDNFRSAMDKAGLQLIVRTAPLPPVYLDADMWEKIVFNLLSNAFKFTLEGSITVDVTATATHAVLTVTDTGVGIPVEELPNMFNRFHRVQNSRGRTYEGTGIGLALVRELVHLHGGTIGVDSVPGKGSVFTVRIPWGTAHLPADNISPGNVAATGSTRQGAAVLPYIEEIESLLADRGAPAGGSPTGASPAGALLAGTPAADAPLDGSPLERPPLGRVGKDSVLIVDDNADMRNHLQSVLCRHYVTIAAANGAEALTLVKERRPSLVLADVMMPVMDGSQLLRTLKQQPETADIPVILLTARAGEASLIEGLDTGADDYLVKPFSGKQLLARVRAQIRIYALRNHVDRQLRSLIMQAPVPIQILRGPGLVIDLVNETTVQRLGWRREDVTGKPFETIIPQSVDLLKRVYESRQPVTTPEMPFDFLRDGNRSPGFIRFTYTPLQDPEGNMEGILVTGDDVTAQVVERRAQQSFSEELEREVAARTSDLVKANKELESFNYVTSHDLQEPLRKIQMFIDRILHGKESPDKLLSKINDSAGKMRELIKSILTYSRFSRSEQGMGTVDLGAVLHEVCRDFECVIEEKEAVIHVGILPVIRANRVQMTQLFTNLLSNALKFSRGAPVIDVTADEVTREGAPLARYVRINFQDNGIGFEAQYSTQIFELFQRLHSKDQYAGSGIGLSIVKKIVDQHRGYIIAESGATGGAVFRIWLPQ